MFKNILRVGAEISILSKIGPGSLKGLNPAAGTEKRRHVALSGNRGARNFQWIES
jgi:hypothetical protein